MQLWLRHIPANVNGAHDSGRRGVYATIIPAISAIQQMGNAQLAEVGVGENEHVQSLGWSKGITTIIPMGA